MTSVWYRYTNGGHATLHVQHAQTILFQYLIVLNTLSRLCTILDSIIGRYLPLLLACTLTCMVSWNWIQPLKCSTHLTSIHWTLLHTLLQRIFSHCLFSCAHCCTRAFIVYASVLSPSKHTFKRLYSYQTIFFILLLLYCVYIIDIYFDAYWIHCTCSTHVSTPLYITQYTTCALLQ